MLNQLSSVNLFVNGEIYNVLIAFSSFAKSFFMKEIWSCVGSSGYLRFFVVPQPGRISPSANLCRSGVIVLKSLPVDNNAAGLVINSFL